MSSTVFTSFFLHLSGFHYLLSTNFLFLLRLFLSLPSSSLSIFLHFRFASVRRSVCRKRPTVRPPSLASAPPLPPGGGSPLGGRPAHLLLDPPFVSWLLPSPPQQPPCPGLVPSVALALRDTLFLLFFSIGLALGCVCHAPSCLHCHGTFLPMVVSCPWPCLAHVRVFLFRPCRAFGRFLPSGRVLPKGLSSLALN